MILKRYFIQKKKLLEMFIIFVCKMIQILLSENSLKTILNKMLILNIHIIQQNIFLIN